MTNQISHNVLPKRLLAPKRGNLELPFQKAPLVPSNKWLMQRMQNRPTTLG